MDEKGKGIVIDPEEPQLDLSLNLGLGGMPPSSLTYAESGRGAEARARPIFANSVYSVGSSSRTVVTDQAAVANVSGVDSSAYSSEVNSYLGVAQQQQQQQQQGPLLYETAPQVAGYEFPAPPELSNYCLINITSRRGGSGGSKKRNPARRPPPREDEARICTNYNCQVKNSPMWRKGPLGPKTLCNRCGIRFRKMQMKAQKERKAAEVAMKATCELLKASRIG